MIKRILLASLFALVMGMFTVKAQDSYLSDNSRNDAVLIQTEQNATLQTLNRTPNKFAFSIQLPYNFNKLGVGMRFSYDFTDVLRFTLDGDYYFYTKPIRTFNTITSAGVKGTKGWGKMFDINPNLNLVYGNNDFHFYLITGIYFSYGYREVTNGVSTVLGNENNTVVIDGKLYYIKEKLIPSIGIGFNGGCGIEFQIADAFRMYFEQQLSLGLMTSWMSKLGASFCF